MKKIMTLLSLIFSFTLLSCNNDKEHNPSVDTTTISFEDYDIYDSFIKEFYYSTIKSKFPNSDTLSITIPTLEYELINGCDSLYEIEFLENSNKYIAAYIEKDKFEYICSTYGSKYVSIDYLDGSIVDYFYTENLYVENEIKWLNIYDKNEIPACIENYYCAGVFKTMNCNINTDFFDNINFKPVQIEVFTPLVYTNNGNLNLFLLNDVCEQKRLSLSCDIGVFQNLNRYTEDNSYYLNNIIINNEISFRSVEDEDVLAVMDNQNLALFYKNIKMCKVNNKYNYTLFKDHLLTFFYNLKNNIIIGDKPLKKGFTIYNDFMAKDFCAYESETSIFNVNNVELNFYFGTNLNNVDVELTDRNIPYIDLVILDQDNNKYLVKRIDENLISYKYNCDINIDSNLSKAEINFNYSIILTIPEEVFNKEEGNIFFAVYGVDINSDVAYSELCTIGIHYEVYGTKVQLSI